MSEQVTGSLMGEGTMIGDAPMWFMLCVVLSIVSLCFIIARYVISEGKE
jgi:hypothetical protein